MKEVTTFKLYLDGVVSDITLKNYISHYKHLPFDTPQELTECLKDDEKATVKTLTNWIDNEGKIPMRKSVVLWLLEMVGRKDIKKYFKKLHQRDRVVKQKYLSFPEIKRIVKNTSDIELKLLIRMQYELACRISELLNVKVDEIDFENKVVLLKRLKGGNVITKALSADTFLLLKQFTKDKKSSEVIFVDRYWNYWNRQRKLFESLGLKKGISSHWFRASRAVYLLQKGHNMETVRDELGHSSLMSTSHYVRESGVNSINLMKKESPEW